jgi:uncharacterized membrane protein
VFFLPGWAVLRALAAEPEDRVGRAALRTALSLAIVVIVGLILHLADSITRAGWLLALGIVTFTACIVSLAGDSRTPAARLPEVSKARLPSCRPRHLAMGTTAICLAAAAIGLSVAMTSVRHEFSYTQAWIVPKQGAPDQVVFGLRNEEAGNESYAVELLVDRHLVQSWSDIPLKPGEAWTTTFRWAGFGEYPHAIQSLKESASGEAAASATVWERAALGAVPRVEAVVYRSNNRSVIYRHVWIAPQCVTDDDTHGRPPCVS